MNFEVIVTEPFERKFKRLSKKYKSLKSDLKPLVESLVETPEQGVPLGKDCYKIRLAISSKGKGKSSGARIITLVRILKGRVFLMDIFDKSEQPNISDKELQRLIEVLSKQL
jgi:hypothetical protein